MPLNDRNRSEHFEEIDWDPKGFAIAINHNQQMSASADVACAVLRGIKNEIHEPIIVAVSTTADQWVESAIQFPITSGSTLELSTNHTNSLMAFNGRQRSKCQRSQESDMTDDARIDHNDGLEKESDFINISPPSQRIFSQFRRRSISETLRRLNCVSPAPPSPEHSLSSSPRSNLQNSDKDESDGNSTITEMPSNSQTSLGKATLSTDFTSHGLLPSGICAGVSESLCFPKEATFSDIEAKRSLERPLPLHSALERAYEKTDSKHTLSFNAIRAVSSRDLAASTEKEISSKSTFKFRGPHVLTMEEEEHEYAAFKDECDGDDLEPSCRDYEGDPRKHRITPETFLRLATGVTEEERCFNSKATVEAKDSIQERRPMQQTMRKIQYTSNKRQRPDPVVVIPQFDRMDGAPLSPYYEVEENPDLLMTVKHDEGYMPPNFGMACPQIGARVSSVEDEDNIEGYAEVEMFTQDDCRKVIGAGMYDQTQAVFNHLENVLEEQRIKMHEASEASKLLSAKVHGIEKQIFLLNQHHREETIGTDRIKHNIRTVTLLTERIKDLQASTMKFVRARERFEHVSAAAREEACALLSARMQAEALHNRDVQGFKAELSELVSQVLGFPIDLEVPIQSSQNLDSNFGGIRYHPDCSSDSYRLAYNHDREPPNVFWYSAGQDRSQHSNCSQGPQNSAGKKQLQADGDIDQQRIDAYFACLPGPQDN